MASKSRIVISAQDQVSPQLKKIQSSLKGLEANTKTSASTANLLKNALQFGGAVMAIRQVTQAMGQLMDTYKIQEQTEAKLGAIIRATGGSAGFTLQQMKDLASQYQKNSIYGDELILNSMGVLATFREIGDDVFPRATQAVMDMATVFGGLDSSSIQLGKALNDPIAGVSALARVGVTFSDAQKEQIRLFVEAGEVAKAQGVILEELEKQVGGTARAMAETATGARDQFKNVMGDFKENIGANIANFFEPMYRWLGDYVSKLNEAMSTQRQFAQAIDGTGDFSAQDYNAMISTKGKENLEIDEQINALKNDPRNWVYGSLDSTILLRIQELEELRASNEAEIRLMREHRQALLDLAKAKEEAQATTAPAPSTPSTPVTYGGPTPFVANTNPAYGMDVSSDYVGIPIVLFYQEQVKTLEETFQEIKSKIAKFNSEVWSTIQAYAEPIFSTWSALIDMEDLRSQKAIDNLKAEFDVMQSQYQSQLELKKALGEDTTAFELEQKEKLEAKEEEIRQKEARAKKKAFESEKKYRMAQTVMAGANAGINALSTVAFPASLGVAMLYAGMVGTQLALIGQQEAPAFATGGLIPYTPGGRLIRLSEREDEWILPQKKLDYMLAGGSRASGGNSFTIAINGPILGTDERGLYMTIQKGIEKLKREGAI